MKVGTNGEPLGVVGGQAGPVSDICHACTWVCCAGSRGLSARLFGRMDPNVGIYGFSSHPVFLCL